MNIDLTKALAISVVGFLASCASTAPLASRRPSSALPQQALLHQPQTDAALRAGLPVSPAGADTDQVCALIPEAEQKLCPLQHTVVLGTRRLVAPLDPKGNLSAPAGVVVYMVAAPGLTVEWLGHLVECYQARTAMAGDALQAREACPLAEPESSYSIASTRDGFAVSIRSTQHAAASRIFDVSQQLAPSNSQQLTALAVRRPL